MSNQAQKEHYESLVDDFDECMFVTHGDDSELRSRPMRIVACRPDGTLVFVTHRDAEKVAELERDDRVNVTLQARHRFVSITGRASLDDDRTRIGRYHNASWNVWFPRGVQDESILLIDVVPTFAEFWDGSGWKRVQYAVEAAKALLNEERIKEPEAAHGSVVL